MQNKTLTLALLFVLSFTLTACTLQDLPVIGPYLGDLVGRETPDIGNKEATIRVWGLWEDPEVMDELIAGYKAEHPNVTVVYEDRSAIKPADYRERVVARISENVEADVILVHNSWVSAIKDNLAPMPSGFMDVEGYQSSFYPAASVSGIHNGNIYAIPFYYDGLVLLYNKDHFAEVGQQEAPTSWEEFRRLAYSLRKMSGSGDSSTIERAGAAMGTADNIDHFSDILGLMFAQTGLTIPDDLTSKAAAETLDYYVMFTNTDKVWDSTMPEANTAFAQGRVSMIFAPSWRILDILASNPELNFGVAPVPQAIPEEPVTWASFWMWTVPASSQNQDVAWDFINYMGSEEAQLALHNAGAKYRPFGVPYARVSLAQQLSSDPYIAPVINTAPFAATNQLAARSGNTRVTDGLRDAVTAVVDGRVDPATALSNYVNGTPQPTR